MHRRLRPVAAVVALAFVLTGAPDPERWQRIPFPMDARDGAGLLELDGSLYLLGGWEHGPLSSEVWRTDDLEHWEFLGDAPWPGRHGAGWVVHDGRMWVIGGDLHADVWSSVDGIEWRREVADAPFGPRYTPIVASYDGRLYLMGGQTWHDGNPIGFNDVWSSEDGREWTWLEDAPWAGRGLIHGPAPIHDGELYVIGGGLKEAHGQAETFAEYRDVWSFDGEEWNHRGTLDIPGRTHFSVAGSPKGCYLTDGSVGRQANLSADVYHAPDCVTFEPIDSPMQERHASSVAWFDGLVIAGGYGAEDVWRYRP